jgi:methionyl-tRNA synthetase
VEREAEAREAVRAGVAVVAKMGVEGAMAGAEKEMQVVAVMEAAAMAAAATEVAAKVAAKEEPWELAEMEDLESQEVALGAMVEAMAAEAGACSRIERFDFRAPQQI